MEFKSIFVTGFVPFLDNASNPSQAAAASAAREFGEVATCVTLPVTWRSAAAPGIAHCASPALTLHFGLAANAKAVRVESRALNCSGDTPDNDGVRAPGPLDAEAEEQRTVAFDPAGLAAALKSVWSGPVETSEDCGGYICNATLWHSLGRHDATAMFVHIPQMSDDDAAVLGAAVAKAIRLFAGHGGFGV